MTTPVGTAPSDIQALPQTESSTSVDDIYWPIDWNHSEDIARRSVFIAHGNGASIKFVEDSLETIKGDYVVYIHGHENSSNSPIRLPEVDTDAFESAEIRLGHIADFGVFNARPDPWAIQGDISNKTLSTNPASRRAVGLWATPSPHPGVSHIGYQRQSLHDLWHAPLEIPVRIENVVKHGIDYKVSGTSLSPGGRYSVDRANSALTKGAGFLANLPPDLGADHVSYQRPTGDVLSLINRYSPGSAPDTDFTGHVLRRINIRSALVRVFRDGSEEVFEYGMESRFSRTLDSIVRSYSNDAMVEMESILAQADISLDVREECLLQLGAIEHNPTSQSRLSLLIDHLWSEQVGVRDSAALGIASMDDPSAIHPLQHAVQVEKSDRLREDLQLVLDQLMATQNCPDS